MTWQEPGRGAKRPKAKTRSDEPPDYAQWIVILRARSTEKELAANDPIRKMDVDSPHWIPSKKRGAGGYVRTMLKGIEGQAHSLALEARLGRPLKEGEVARHLCGWGQIRECDNPYHLEVGSQADNAQDSVVHGSRKRGEENPNAIISDDAVEAIRAAASRGVKQIALAREYGVDPSLISAIVRKRARLHPAAQ